MTDLSHPKYRPDIDGLRAFAVLAVVVFHAFPNVLRGGFVGVDVFFVISGYLISTILFENFATRRFTFLEFYERRIRRIFPALILVLISVLILGWFTLFPDEYAQLGKHVMGGTLFGSNFVLWGESGYFDNASDTKPLLHLWSLGIEEQFYLVFPILLWLGYRCKLRTLYLLIILGFSSLAFNFYLGANDRVADFYSPLTRFWELMAGAGLAYGQLNFLPRLRIEKRRSVATFASWFGLVLLTVAVLSIKKEDAFPYWRAMVPVLGAMCIIWSGPDTFFNDRVLSNRLLRWIGLISFPLYLWHWALLAFARIVKGDHVSAAYRLGIVAVSFFLSWLTYRFVEKPLRYGSHGLQKSAALFICLAGLGSTGYWIWSHNGLADRMVQAVNLPLNTGFDGGDHGFSSNNCTIMHAPMFSDLFGSCRSDTRESPNLLLIGDSKSEVLFDALVRSSRPGHRWMLIGGNGTKGSFAPLLTDNPLYERHQKAAYMALDAIDQTPNATTVVIASATRVLFKLGSENSIEDLAGTTLYEEVEASLDRFVLEIIKKGRQVVLVIDNPTLPPPKDCQNRQSSSAVINWALNLAPNPNCELTFKKHHQLSERYRSVIYAVAQKHPRSVKVIDTAPYLCDTTAAICPAWMNNRSMYSYSDHVSDYAAGLVAPAINQAAIR